MSIEITIGIVIIILMVGGMFLFFRINNRKEVLTILQEEDTLHLLLSQDNYWELDISEIKEDGIKIREALEKIILARAFELKGLVGSVAFIDAEDKAFEEHLLKLIVKSSDGLSI